jgi:RNA polymerase sigma factor (sigma-70 family)
MPDDLVTQWITQLAEGDEAAAQRIWSRYFDRLIRVARDKLRDARRRAADEEDVVLSAFNSFCRGLRAGRFPRLDDRHDLWKVLVTLTARKAVDQLRRERTQKRDEGKLRGESAFRLPSMSQEHVGGIGAVLGREPSPEFAAQMADECEALLDRLDDERLRQTALLKLEGYTTGEIAQAMDCAESTVDRRLARIRRKWVEGTEG